MCVLTLRQVRHRGFHKVGWIFTFVFIVVTWVFFRAATVDDEVAMLAGMSGLHGIVATKVAKPNMPGPDAGLLVEATVSAYLDGLAT